MNDCRNSDQEMGAIKKSFHQIKRDCGARCPVGYRQNMDCVFDHVMILGGLTEPEPRLKYTQRARADH